MVQKNNCNDGDVHLENPSKPPKPLKKTKTSKTPKKTQNLKNPSKTHSKPPKILKKTKTSKPSLPPKKTSKLYKHRKIIDLDDLGK